MTLSNVVWQVPWHFCPVLLLSVGSRALSFSDHYCQSTCHNVILSVCSFFKVHLLRQLLSELDEILTQCSSVWCVYTVLTDSWSGPYDVIVVSEPNHLLSCLSVRRETLLTWYQSFWPIFTKLRDSNEYAGNVTSPAEAHSNQHIDYRVRVYSRDSKEPSLLHFGSVRLYAISQTNIY